MFNKKQAYFLVVLLLVLGFVFIQKQVFAQWASPGFSPGSGVSLNFLENPLQEDLNLGTHNITNAGTGVFSGNVQVGTLNGLDPASFSGGGGDVTNPLSEDLSGGSIYAINNLQGCDATSGEVCGALEGQAGKSTKVDSYPVGLYGYTQSDSDVYPSYGVYGVANNSAGFGLVGVGSSGGSGVYGYTNGAASYAGYFRNDNVSGVALGVLGSTATDINGGEMTVADGAQDILSISHGALGAPLTEITGDVIRSYGDIGFYSIGNDDSFAGVSAIGGEVGLFGSGPIGVLGEGYYGGVFNGERSVGWTPPPAGGGGNTPPSENPISRLFGLNQTLASTNDPGYLGLVAAGGYTYSGGVFNTAGLGICAISGELVHDDVSTNDYFTYCQDAGGRNNYSGFFAGDIYVKKGSLQINDTLAAGENLIYGNSSSAASGSYLIKLQNGAANKFYVTKDGAGYFSSALSVGSISSTGDISAKNVVLNSSGSYVDFAGGGTAGPTCNAANKGIVYYFSLYNVLCACNGTGWQSLMNSITDDGYCTNTTYTPK